MKNRTNRYYRPEFNNQAIPEKANRILNFILVAFILIVFRIWHLAIVQYDDKIAESKKPQKRVIVESSKRGTIRDRFNIPLAINKLQYQATILYSQLKPIPVVVWEKDGNGKKIKRYKRREYIGKLAQLLAKELSLDADRIEDLIYSKASYYYQIPYVIKNDLTEKEYYRLKMLEKDWLGIHVRRLPKREYPKGKLAGDIIGYMGAINLQEYENIIHEMKALENYIRQAESGNEPEEIAGISNTDQARRRLKDLEEQAYTINDTVGKTGIESRFEHELRGYHGKKSYYSDARGNFFRELPGSKEPLSGQRILLTISSELQEYAEKLLAQNESIREAKVSGVDAARKALISLKQPWIKGGAIIAMDPSTGEILTMASYPRFDPNDFVGSSQPEVAKVKRSQVAKWLESESYIASLWDQKRPLERERYDDDLSAFYDEAKWIDWDTYLKMILPANSPVIESLNRIENVRNAVELQMNIDELLRISKQNNVYWVFNQLYQGENHISHKGRIPLKEKLELEMAFRAHEARISAIKKQIDPWIEPIPNCYDKVLCVDLCRLAVSNASFSEGLLKQTGDQKLSLYRDACASLESLQEVVRSQTKELFHAVTFKEWRKENEKAYLQQKRLEEKLARKYPKPFLDYFDAKEAELFEIFWNSHRYEFLQLFLTGSSEFPINQPELLPYLNHFAAWHKELSEGAHPDVSWRKHYFNLQKALSALDSSAAASYLKTLRNFQELNRPLLGRYKHLRETADKQQLEKHLAAAFYPLHGFGYGRSQAYRQAATQGSIFKLVTAYTALIQRYNDLKGKGITQSSLNPLEIHDQTFKSGKETFVGYFSDSKPIPQLYKGGRLLKSSVSNIGKIDLLKAIETSSNPYFSILAGDVFKNPEDLAEAARVFNYGSATGIDLPGEIPGKVPQDLSYNRTGLYAMANGQHTLVVTPLQTSVMLSSLANGGKILKPNIVLLQAGKKPHRYSKEGLLKSSYNYQEALKIIGIDFPLFDPLREQEAKGLVKRYKTTIQHEVFMPAIVRSILLEGMKRVVARQMREGLASLSKVYRDYPEAISDYVDLKDQLIGKTSTAESMEHLDLDPVFGTNMYTHVWFGGIVFPKEEGMKTYIGYDQFQSPELVVVVYLRYGHFGKETAPLAAQVIQKWREIKEKRCISSQDCIKTVH